MYLILSCYKPIVQELILCCIYIAQDYTEILEVNLFAHRTKTFVGESNHIIIMMSTRITKHTGTLS